MFVLDWFQVKWKYIHPSNLMATNMIPIMDKETHVQFIVSEKIQRSIYQFLMDIYEKKQNDLWKLIQLILFQCFHFLETSYLVTGFISFDFHLQNCMSNHYQFLENKRLLYKRFRSKNIYALDPIYHHGNIVKIIDFGRSRIYPRFYPAENWMKKEKETDLKLIYNTVHENLYINKDSNLFIDTRNFIAELCLKIDPVIWADLKIRDKMLWEKLVEIFDKTLGLDAWKNIYFKSLKIEKQKKLNETIKKYFGLHTTFQDFRCLHLIEYELDRNHLPDEDFYHFYHFNLIFIKFNGQIGMSSTDLLNSFLFDDLITLQDYGEKNDIFLSEPNDDWILK